MPRSQPDTDVSAFLIESPPPTRRCQLNGRSFLAMIIPSSSRSARAKVFSCSTPPHSIPAATSSGSSFHASTPGSPANGWPGTALPMPRSGGGTPGTSWAGWFRVRACEPCTSTSPTLGGRNDTKSAGSSPTRWLPTSNECLKPGGELRIASDVEEYFGIINALVSGRERFHEQPVREPKTPEHTLDYLTNFERKYRIEGRTIFRASYRLD